MDPMTARIDLNSDLGESLGAWRLGDDDAMLGVVTSANVACGFHAGDSLTLQRTCAAAVDGSARSWVCTMACYWWVAVPTFRMACRGWVAKRSTIAMCMCLIEEAAAWGF